MKKFYIRSSTGVYLDVHTLNLLVNPYGVTDETFLSALEEMIQHAKANHEIVTFGGGALLDLWIHPNGVIEITKCVMCLDLVDVKE